MLLKFKQLFWIIFILFDFCVLAALLGGVYYLESDGPRHELEKILGEKIGRKVVFEENLDFKIYPWLGVDTGPVRISAAQGSNYENQLTVKGIDFRVRVLPLLQGDLEVDKIVVNSPVFRMDRSKTGELDLPNVKAGNHADSDDPVDMIFKSVSVSGISVFNATCVYTDVETGNSLNVSGVSIRTGPLRKGTPLAFDINAMLDTDLFDMQAETTIKGLADVSWINKAFSLSETSLSLDVKSTELLGPEQVIQAIANLDFNLMDGRIDVKGLVVQGGGVRLTGDAKCENIYHNPDFKGSLKSTKFDPKSVFSKFTPSPIPTGFKDILNSASFSVDFHSTLDMSSLSNMILQVDETTIKGEFMLRDYSRPWVEFDVYADKVLLDPYTRVFALNGQKKRQNENKPGNAKTSDALKKEKSSLFEFRRMVIADLVRRIPCQGKLEIGTLVYDGVHLDSTRLAISPGPKVAALSVGKGSYLDGDFSLGIDLDFDDTKEKDTLYLSGKGKIDPFTVTRIPLKNGNIKFRSGKADLKLKTLSSYGKTLGELVRNLKFNIELQGRDIAASLGHKKIPSKYKNIHARNFKFDLAGAPLSRKSPDGLIGRKLAVVLSGEMLKPDVKIDTRFHGDVYCNRVYPDRLILKESVLDFYAGGTGLPVVKKDIEISLAGQGNLEEGSLSLDRFALRSGKINLHGEVDGKRLAAETASAKGKLELDKVECAEIFALFGIEKPETQAPDAFESVELNSVFELNGENLNLRVNNVRLDNATAEGTFELVDFKKPFLNFVINGHNVDVDRFLPPDEDENVHALIGNGNNEFEVKLPEWKFPDALLGSINATGKVVCDYFRIFDFGGSQISADVGMQNSVINIRNIEALFHKGNLAGDLDLGLRNGTVSLDSDFECRGFDAALFFADYTGRDVIHGKADASLKLTGSSSANTYFTNSMAGSLAFKITDGSYLFESTAAKNKKAKKEPAPTSFSIMQGSINGQEGQFKVNDYLLKTDYLTATAKGGFSFPKDSINLMVEADIIKLPNLYLKLVNAFLGAMTGVNVSVTGKLSDPKVEVKGLERWSDVLNDVLGLPEQSFMFFRDLIF